MEHPSVTYIFETWQLVVAIASIVLPVIGVMVAGWINFNIKLAKLETFTQLEVQNMKSDLLERKVELDQHTRWFYSHNRDAATLKEELQKHIQANKDIIMDKMEELKLDLNIIKKSTKN